MNKNFDDFLKTLSQDEAMRQALAQSNFTDHIYDEKDMQLVTLITNAAGIATISLLRQYHDWLQKQ